MNVSTAIVIQTYTAVMPLLRTLLASAAELALVLSALLVGPAAGVVFGGSESVLVGSFTATCIWTSELV